MKLLRILILGAAATLAACATHPGETSAKGPPENYHQVPRNNPDAAFQRSMGGGPSYF